MEGEEGGMDGAGVLFNVFLTFLHCFGGVIGISLEFCWSFNGISLEIERRLVGGWGDNEKRKECSGSCFLTLKRV